MKFWYSKNLLAYILWPLSVLYSMVVAIRWVLYKAGIKKTIKFNVPVIVVGNVTVGGAGKTPLVIWLANFLKQQGYRPGVVSRGYGGRAEQYPCKVTTESNPQQVGDEPLLIVQHTACSMVVDPDRVRAVRALLKETDCNVVISDDGLQHYALGRNVEIIVIDGARRFGNGFCLPAGPLREPIDRIQSADFVVANGQANANEYSMRLIPQHFYQVIDAANQKTVDYFQCKKIYAVAGIGNPNRFFNTLRQLGLNIIEQPFSDHHPFQLSDFRYDRDAIIIMTEKDAVKCQTFADERFWCLPVMAELDGQFKTELLRKLRL